MKKIHWGPPLREALKGVRLVDRWLLLFMAVLLVQSACSLFFSARSEEAARVDVIVRTASASIFGYVLSGNFNRRAPAGQEGAQPPEPPDSGRGRSGENRLQIAAAAGVGLFCLATLLLLRWTGPPEHASATAAVAQLRDFISSCVGFLIGCPECRERRGQL